METIAKLFPDIERAIISSAHLSGGSGGHTAIDHSIAGNNNILHAAPDLDAYAGGSTPPSSASAWIPRRRTGSCRP